MAEEESFPLDLTIQVYQHINTPSAIAHLFLAGTSAKAITYISMKNEPFVFATACGLLGHGMFGALIKTHMSLPMYPRLLNAYEWFRLTTKSFVLPFMNAHFCKIIGEDDFYLYSHLLSGFAPLVYGLGRQFADTSLNYRTERILDIVVLGNACSLAYVGATNESPFALSLAFWQMFAQYFPPVVETRIDTRRYDIETLGMSVFALILALMCREQRTIGV